MKHIEPMFAVDTDHAGRMGRGSLYLIIHDWTRRLASITRHSCPASWSAIPKRVIDASVPVISTTPLWHSDAVRGVHPINLIREDDRAVYGDKGYANDRKQRQAEAAGVLWAVKAKAKLGRPLSISQGRRNRRVGKSAPRSSTFSDRLFMDETTAPVLDPGRGVTKKGYFWAIVSDDRGHGGPGPPIVLFRYAPGRSGAFAEQFLDGCNGRFLQCDAYDGYNRLTEVVRPQGPWTLVYCWSHLRRRFVKLVRNSKSPIAEAVVQQIAQLYAVEATVRGSSPDIRLAARKAHSRPIVAALKPWFEKQLSMISSGSTLAEDIRYGLNHWKGLTRFLDDGRLELDTNPVENAIRPICLTRKNALFAGHEIGAENWALLASIVATCKLNDINPVAYIAETLEAIIAGHPQSKVDDLMPWRFRKTSSQHQ